MRQRSTSGLTLAALSCSLMLTACAGKDTEIILDEAEVNIALPTALINAEIPDRGQIRPTIQLSNGAYLSISRLGSTGNSWTGQINVEAGRSYTATIVWEEDYNGEKLPLAEMTQQFDVASDGSVTLTSSTDYRTDIDSDSDGTDNLQERINGSNPLESTNPANDESGVADLVIPRIAAENAPDINGRDVTVNEQGTFTGEWSAAIQMDNSGAPLYIDQLMIDFGADDVAGSPFRRWAAMHDGTYLYVLVMVDDDDHRYRDSGSQLTQDDSLELFIDGDNSKLNDYDENDFHRIIPISPPGDTTQPAYTGDVPGPSSTTAVLGLTFVTGPGAGPAGLRRPRFKQDVYELKIELASAGIDIDTPFGFELQINDDDDGGSRDAKWAWKHASGNGQNVDDTMRNPSLMGTLKLD